MNTAEEPSPEDRLIEFTVYDGINNGSASLTLSIVTVDDNPTNVRKIN